MFYSDDEVKIKRASETSSKKAIPKASSRRHSPEGREREFPTTKVSSSKSAAMAGGDDRAATYYGAGPPRCPPNATRDFHYSVPDHHFRSGSSSSRQSRNSSNSSSNYHSPHVSPLIILKFIFELACDNALYQNCSFMTGLYLVEKRLSKFEKLRAK